MALQGDGEPRAPWLADSVVLTINPGPQAMEGFAKQERHSDVALYVVTM